ncbi:MAG: LytR C-terminal domain-containing protein [Bifidobacteriaceae bacterium]|nr:LytR C-terminal domain-containing protein [Bifidobacteriaceae bacterium]
MSKNAYPYPPDEFDQIDLNSRPKEVHAAHRTAWSRVWPLLLVIVLVPTVAFVAVHFLADRLPGSGGASTPPPTQETGGTSAEPSLDQSPSELPPSPEESEEPAPTPPPTEVEPSVAAPTVDKAVKVTVYNAGQTSGAAAAAAEKLVAGGFANADKAFPPNPSNPDQSTVYYSTDAQAETAKEVASVLSVSAVQLDPQVAGGNIVVVVK